MVANRQRRAAPELVSVIIPVRNGAATIDEQLAALAVQTYRGPMEVIVADNGSTDDTLVHVEQWAPRFERFRLVPATGRRGAGFARNVAVTHATGDFLAFCDADDRVEREWLEALVAAAPGFDIVTGPLNSIEINNSGTAAWRRRSTGGLPKTAGFLPFAPSGNLGMWADRFRDLGGFNEGYQRQQDVELSWRALLDHATLGFVPAAVVHYRHRDTLRAVGRQAYGTGVTSARLYRDFRARGMPRSNPIGAARLWWWLVLHTLHLASPKRRGRWVRFASGAVGRVSGSVQFRVFFV